MRKNGTNNVWLKSLSTAVSLWFSGVLTILQGARTVMSFELRNICGFHRLAASPAKVRSHRVARPRGGFTLVEMLVATTIVMILGSLAASAVAMASTSQKKLRTKTLVAKLDVTIAAQYASYASRSVDPPKGKTRGEFIRDYIVAFDLPDDWKDVETLAQWETKLPEWFPQEPDAASKWRPSPSMETYIALWDSLSDADRQRVQQENSSAECLFLVVMYGGLVDCLDCGSLQMEVGDQDGDDMPEFLDAWDNPVEFVLWPRDLRLPPESSQRFFSIVKPFDPTLPEAGEAKGGVMRPLIFSAGPDGESGMNAAGAPLVSSVAHRDNITNFDVEAKR